MFHKSLEIANKLRAKKDNISLRYDTAGQVSAEAEVNHTGDVPNLSKRLFAFSFSVPFFQLRQDVFVQQQTIVFQSCLQIGD
jgi:hypothetical protein